VQAYCEKSEDDTVIMKRSFVTLANDEYEQACKQNFNSNFGILNAAIKNSKTHQFNRESEIQLGIHAICLLLSGISKYNQIALPYPLSMRLNGFIIKDAGGDDNTQAEYPLHLLTRETMACHNDEATLTDKKFKAEHMIYFEMALILLDANIRYLLHVNMYTGPY
jgi:hypothetical protein